MSYLKTIRPHPKDKDIARLRDLNTRWQAWSDRMAAHSPQQMECDFKAARENFIEDPSLANERRLKEFADWKLMSLQYQAVRDCCKIALKKLAYELRDIMEPILNPKLAYMEQRLDYEQEDYEREQAQNRSLGIYTVQKVNDPIPTLKRAISQTRSHLHTLEAHDITRTPKQWALMIGVEL